MNRSDKEIKDSKIIHIKNVTRQISYIEKNTVMDPRWSYKSWTTLKERKIEVESIIEKLSYWS